MNEKADWVSEKRQGTMRAEICMWLQSESLSDPSSPKQIVLLQAKRLLSKPYLHLHNRDGAYSMHNPI